MAFFSKKGTCQNFFLGGRGKYLLPPPPPPPTPVAPALRSVNNATLNIFTSSGGRELPN